MAAGSSGSTSASASRRVARPGHLGQRDAVGEVRVHEALELVDGVVDGVVLAEVLLAAEAEVQGRDAQVLQERRVVRARAQGMDGQVVLGAQLLPLVRLGVEDALGAQALQHADALLGVGHVSRHLVDERLQGVGAAHRQEAAGVAVGVDVGHGLRLELVGVGLGPLRGAQQARLLAVPRAVDDGPPWAPARLDQLRHAPRLLQHRHLAADRVGRAVHPGVVVVAAQHPLVGPLGAGQPGDDVPDRLEAPVEGELEVDLRRAGAEVVGDGQGAAPRLRAPPGPSWPPAAAARRRRRWAAPGSWSGWAPHRGAAAWRLSWRRRRGSADRRGRGACPPPSRAAHPRRCGSRLRGRRRPRSSRRSRGSE